MNMFARCLLALILTVALVQTKLQCYKCSGKPTEKSTPTQLDSGFYQPWILGGKRELSSGECKDGELGELENCSGTCFKSSSEGYIFRQVRLPSEDFT